MWNVTSSSSPKLAREVRKPVATPVPIDFANWSMILKKAENRSVYSDDMDEENYGGVFERIPPHEYLATNSRYRVVTLASGVLVTSAVWDLLMFTLNLFIYKKGPSTSSPGNTECSNCIKLNHQIMKTAEVMEDINGAKVNVDPQRLKSIFKLIFNSTTNDQRVNEQEVAMSDLLFEEEEQHKSLNNLVDSDLEGQELMAVDALMKIIDFDNTPKQAILSITFFEKHNELDTLSMNTDCVQGSNDDNETFVDVLVVDDEQPDVKTIQVPFARETKVSKYLQSPYTNPLDSTPQQPKLQDRTKKCKKRFLPLIGPDGEEIPPWNEDLNRVKGAPKDRVDVPKDILSYLRENKEDKKGC
ncbi:hypothetical protein CTI12_AA245460 [Artemisia annua]|uniref:Uncharacterized protein n=1 Tax=Artemisia annua TaxID=35608 RepID=A0A2U1NH75_ARTAN|nr:hypothetical protein CTI12_AA245460 [Artemisia annua]